MMFCVARCKRAGFTLIEIMIVIAIIAILAGIVVPSLTRSRQEAQLKACEENCRVYMIAITEALIRPNNDVTHYINQVYPSGGHVSFIMLGHDLVDYGFIDHVLTCPRKDTTSASYFLSYNDYPIEYGGDPYSNFVVRCGSGSSSGGSGHIVGDNCIRPGYALGYGAFEIVIPKS